MSEFKYKRCPKCGAIMKVREDIMTSSMPPMYVYDCPECKWLDFDVEKYPYTVQPEIKGAIVNYPPEPTEASYAVKFRNEAAKDILASLLTSNAVFKNNKGKHTKRDVDMNTELAKTLTTALVQFLDRERPEGTMCCSNTDCENIKGAFEEGEYDVVEAFIQKKLTRMTEFEKVLADTIGYAISQSVVEPNYETYKFVKDWSERLLDAAKKELCKDCNANLEGYMKGRQDALKEMDKMDKVYKHEGPTTPVYWPPCLYGGECTNPFHDCINCHRQSTIGINTTTGTSTSKAVEK